jgi:hypothetical protein
MKSASSFLLALCTWLLLSNLSFAAGDTSTADHASGDANSANNPVEPRFTLEYWNYYSPVLNNIDGTAENGLGRILIPFKIGDVQQHFHIIPPVTTNPTATRGQRTGLGDMQIYNFSLGKFDFGLPEKVTLGIGPLIAPVTHTSPNLGPSRVQAGAAGVVVAPQPWGLLGVLATYQHTLSGPDAQLITVQPNIFINLKDSWYLRSSGIMRFNTGNHTSYIPVGFGLGKVVQLENGYTLNAYIEAQPSVYKSGVGAPAFQIFTGIELQFPTELTSGLKF